MEGQASDCRRADRHKRPHQRPLHSRTVTQDTFGRHLEGVPMRPEQSRNRVADHHDGGRQLCDVAHDGNDQVAAVDRHEHDRPDNRRQQPVHHVDTSRGDHRGTGPPEYRWTGQHQQPKRESDNPEQRDVKSRQTIDQTDPSTAEERPTRVQLLNRTKAPAASLRNVVTQSLGSEAQTEPFIEEHGAPADLIHLGAGQCIFCYGFGRHSADRL